MKRDYYRILGISKSSNERAIKKAYKRLAMKYHPDKNPNDKSSENKFKEIKEAYETLIDKNKRAYYDQYGHYTANNKTNSGFGGFSSKFNNSSSDFGDIFGDIFGDMFGGNKRRKRKSKENLTFNIDLTLEESVCGTVKKVNIPMLKKCNYCNGSGSKPGFKLECCITCNGKGQVHMRQGFFTVQQTCQTCNGKGSFIRHLCKNCNGQGRKEILKSLSIKVPSGVNTNDRIKLNGEGPDNSVGITGDLYVRIIVKKHDMFERKGNNLHCKIPIGIVTASLGGNIEIPTINGRIKFKIPPETQTNKLFCIKGKGVKPFQHNKCGDLLCKIIVKTPTNLNERQKKLLKKFDFDLDYEEKIKESKKSVASRILQRSINLFNNMKKFFEDIINRY
ncbi:Chaperone protein DnaJ [Candidatus Annandia adelgestsuga]|uniref:Chaperone protein DnaJ n=1 Tax=Candidatus Annandia adelgestsuga TaxID=1302411 RepID=A0A3S9J7K7_9ENTR|nr:molecular chaperone DnaJ [Candidatus Annandia adelgestsuga]AZP36254.1 Chaperone protein DnaJ [Candidatus Annandia adelgestsuga]